MYPDFKLLSEGETYTLKLNKRQLVELMLIISQAEENTSSYDCKILSKKIVQEIKDKIYTKKTDE
jgi:hypothetical protein